MSLVTGSKRLPQTGRRRFRYKKTYNVNSKNIYRLVNNSMYHKIETKQAVTSSSGGFITSTGVLHEITDIIQGTDQDNRIGNVIRKLSFMMRLQIFMDKTVSHMFRVSVIRTKGDSQPTTTSVSANIGSPWDFDKYRILFDNVFYVNSGGVSRIVNLSKRFNLTYKGYGTRTRYTTNAGDSGETDRIYVFMRDDNAGDYSYVGYQY